VSRLLVLAHANVHETPDYRPVRSIKLINTEYAHDDIGKSNAIMRCPAPQMRCWSFVAPG
jgi:hypothetical protein